MKDYRKRKFQIVPIDLGGDDGIQNINFYPLPVGILWKMRKLKGPLAKSIAAAITSMKTSGTQSSISKPEVLEGAVGEGSESNVYVATSNEKKELSSSAVSLLYNHVEAAVDGIVEAGMSDDSKEIVAEIIVSSAADFFKTPAEDKTEVFDKMPIGMALQFLKGALSASAEGLAFLGKSLPQGLATAAGQGVKDLMEKMTPKR